MRRHRGAEKSMKRETIFYLSEKTRTVGPTWILQQSVEETHGLWAAICSGPGSR